MISYEHSGLIIRFNESNVDGIEVHGMNNICRVLIAFNNGTTVEFACVSYGEASRVGDELTSLVKTALGIEEDE